MTIKQQADNKILMNSKLLNNENYFQGLMMNVVFDGFEQSQLDLAPETALYINDCLVKEYLNEYQGNPQW
jgi:type I restriction enzyme R subunit